MSTSTPPCSSLVGTHPCETFAKGRPLFPVTAKINLPHSPETILLKELLNSCCGGPPLGGGRILSPRMVDCYRGWHARTPGAVADNRTLGLAPPYLSHTHIPPWDQFCFLLAPGALPPTYVYGTSERSWTGRVIKAPAIPHPALPGGGLFMCVATSACPTVISARAESCPIDC